MRRTATALALSLLAAVTACNGGSGSGSPSQSPSASASPSPTTTPPAKAELDAALLATTDLPAGYQAPQGAEDVEIESATATPTASASQDPCAFEAEIGDDPLYGREIGFLGSAAIITQQVEVYATGRAAVTLAEARTALSGCKELTSTEEDGTVSKLDVAPFPGLPALGDEVFGLKMSGKPGTEDADGRAAIVAVRIGDVLSTVIAFGDATLSDTLMIDLITKAEAKLEAVLS